MPCQAFLSLRRGTRRRSGCSVRGWLRRRGRLPPLFLLRGHLFAVLPHLVTHRFGTYRLATGCLAASCEVPHHLLAVLPHLVTLRRRGRLPPLFLLRGHLFAVLPHLVTHRFGTYRLATGCLAASCAVPHHLLAVLPHLVTLRRRGRLPPLFLLRGHLFAVLPHLVTHRFGTYRLATGCLAASCEVPHHLLAVLPHLVTLRRRGRLPPLFLLRGHLFAVLPHLVTHRFGTYRLATGCL